MQCVGLPLPIGVLTVLTVLVIGLAYKLFRVATNPLRSVPGPEISRWTNLRLKYAVLTGEKCRYVHSLHVKYGRIVRISPEEVSVADIDAAKAIYRMGSPFTKTDWYARFVGLVNIFSTKDQHHHTMHRRLLANSFNEKWIRRLEPDIARNCRLAVQRMEDDVKARGVVDVFKWFTFMATDVIGEACFGESFRMLQTGKPNQYVHDIEVAASSGVVRAEFPILPVMVQWLPIGPGKAIKELVARLDGYTDESLARYWKLLKVDPENVKPTLLLKEYDALDNGTLSFDELKKDAGGFIVAGTDTTAISATYVVWRLAQRVDIQRALIEEVSALPLMFTDLDLQQCQLLERVIKEALRLDGPVQEGLPREVPAAGAEFCGYFIPGGKVVSVPSFTTQRDPSIWHAPEAFEPDRWLQVSKEMKDSYFPFGGGSRICIGMHFALVELRLVLAHFYRAFPSGVQPAFIEGFDEADMLPISYFLAAPKGKKCFVRPRK